MTAAVFEPKAENSTPFSARVSPYLLVALVILCAAVVWQIWIGLLGDVTWLLMLDERWFAGERPYVDFLEINPPASLLVYAPEVALAQALGLRSETIVVASGFVATTLSLGLAGTILARAQRSKEIGAFGFAVALLALFCLPGDAFMERDVLAAVFLVPFLALCLARALRVAVDGRHALLAGLGVGMMVALKPPYALAAVFPALYVLWRAGPRVVLQAIEVPAAAFVVLAYGLVAWYGFPAYALNMLPALMNVYLAVRESALELLHSEGGLDFCALMLLGGFLARGRIRDPALAIAGLAAVGAFVGYYAQGKGWLYQAYPAIAFATLFAGLAWERSRADARERGLAVLSFGVALILGVLVDRWGAPLIAATILALVLRRLWLGAPADLVPAFARMAAAAALGAACAAFVPGSPPSDALGKALMRLKPHPTVMAITESFGYVHPMVRRVGAVWVQSVPNLVVTSGARLLMDQHPDDTALAAKLAPYVEADRQRLVADIVNRKPDAIIVGPLNSRFHAAVWSDPALAAAMRDYRLYAVNDLEDHPGELWARRDLFDLRSTIAPEAAR